MYWWREIAGRKTSPFSGIEILIKKKKRNETGVVEEPLKNTIGESITRGSFGIKRTGKGRFTAR